MLDFYIIDPNLELPYYDSKGIHVGGLTLEDVKWLHQHGIVKSFSDNKYNELEIESLPYVHDFQLPLETIVQMHKRYEECIIKKPGLSTDSLEKYGQILGAAMKAQQGLQAICD